MDKLFNSNPLTIWNYGVPPGFEYIVFFGFTHVMWDVAHMSSYQMMRRYGFIQLWCLPELIGWIN